jgi:hypothetical protein
MVGEIRNHSLPEAFIVTQVAPPSADGDHVSKPCLRVPAGVRLGSLATTVRRVSSSMRVKREAPDPRRDDYFFFGQRCGTFRSLVRS